jgi:hypothetical protein
MARFEDGGELDQGRTKRGTCRTVRGRLRLSQSNRLALTSARAIGNHALWHRERGSNSVGSADVEEHAFDELIL